MNEQVTEVQLIEPTKLEGTKPPEKVKLKFPFLEVPVEMSRNFFQKILNNQQYKIVNIDGVKNVNRFNS